MAELATVADVKAYAKITGSEDDALLASLLESAEQALRDYCSRPLGWSQASVAETLSGSGNNSLVVTNVPVAESPAPVVVLLTGAVTTETVAASRYRFDPDSGEFRIIEDDPIYACAWPAGFRNVTMTYTGGYAAIPANLSHAAILATLWLFYGSGQDPSMASEGLGAYSYTKWVAVEGHSIPPEVEAMVAPYRRSAGVAT